MSEDFKSLWAEYSRLVLTELSRMNNNYESLRSDIDTRFGEVNEKLSDVKTTERSVSELKVWQEKINEVWSPSQMKEAKDEIYKQKNRWTATIAILAFIQIIVGLLAAFNVF